MRKATKFLLNFVAVVMLAMLVMSFVFVDRWLLATLSLAGFIVSVVIWVMSDEY